MEANDPIFSKLTEDLLKDQREEVKRRPKRRSKGLGGGFQKLPQEGVVVELPRRTISSSGVQNPDNLPTGWKSTGRQEGRIER